MLDFVRETIRDNLVLDRIGFPIPIDGSYTYDHEDYIFSVLLDNPNGYILSAGRRVAYVVILGRGMVRIVHDFREYSDPEVAMYIHHIRLAL